MSSDPAYVRRLLDQARQEGQWYCGQPDAVALCFEVLALFPDNREAADLIYELFCDEWLIYDNRIALQRLIDEWDDRPWQQRRRIALSFRYMSRWDGWYREHEDGYEVERKGPGDVADLLGEGHGQLIHAYCLGDDECVDFAWPLFIEAFDRTNDPRNALLWVGKQYAELGFFADAVEVLAELCSRFNDLASNARRLLAEVRWWRDNAHRLPWLPPPGDGARYWRMMSFIDPHAPSDEEVIRSLRDQKMKIRGYDWKPTIDPALAALVGNALSVELPPAAPALVDWSFLDTDDGQPGEPPQWAKRMIRHFPKEMIEDIINTHRWSREIQRPDTPPRHDPDEPPFDPAEFFGDDDDDLFDESSD